MDKFTDALYKYRLCPSLNDENILTIQFLDGEDNNDFSNHFLQSIQAINPGLEKKEDIWMNDEVLFRFASDAGAFTLSRDIWMTFILPEENPDIILHIHDLLLRDKRFDFIDSEPPR